MKRPSGSVQAWHSDETPAELVGFAALTTPEQGRAFLHHLARSYPDRIEVEMLGQSAAGRPVLAAHVPPASQDADGRPAARPLRVLAFAQQHGDEPAGHEASLLLVRDLAVGRAGWPADRIDLWIIPQLNPDAAAPGRRRTADEVDLNRGHHVLATTELEQLYALYHRVRPHLTIDLHEFNAERHRFADGGLPAYDVMADAATTPNAGLAVREWPVRALEAVDERLARRGYAFRRYVRGDPASPDGSASLRYSTVHAIDGRNTPSLFGSLGFIVEAIRFESQLARLGGRVAATYQVVTALLRFAARHGRSIRSVVSAERQSLRSGEGRIVLQTEYRPGPLDGDGRYRFIRPSTGERGEYVVEQARIAIEVTRERQLPRAYWLRLHADDPRRGRLLAILAGHGIRTRRLSSERSALVERFTLTDVAVNARDGDRSVVAVAGNVRRRVIPAGARIIPTDQLGGRLAGVLLEPDSMDGLLAGGRWPALAGERHPVERILAFDDDPER